MALTVSPGPQLKPLLRESLAKRLQEIEPIDASTVERIEQADCQNPEEALRRLMVVLKPRLQRRMLSPNGFAELLVLARIIGNRAQWDDLRFIDALNSIHEVWPAKYQLDFRSNFNRSYAHGIRNLLAE